MLDKTLNVARKVPNETTPEFEVEVVIIAQRSTPVLLCRRGPPSSQVGKHLHQSSMGLFKSSRFQLFESWRLLRCELKPVSFERSEVGN